MVPQSRRAVFVGCARDCARALPSVLDNVSRMAETFDQAAFVWVENDSVDDTKRLLTAWCKGRPDAHIIGLDGLGQAERARTRRIEFARNTYVAFMRLRQLGSFDFTVMLDMDEVNAQPLDIDAFRRAVAFIADRPDTAGVFANQGGPYYDQWALRHPERCPGDIWEEVCDRVARDGLSDAEAFKIAVLDRLFTLPPDADPLEVDSAFGGLAIYRTAHVLANPNAYVGERVKVMDAQGRLVSVRMQACEHVAFNRGLRGMGKHLYVLPWLQNVSTSHSAVHFTTAWREFFF
jgi:hypothetical protein